MSYTICYLLLCLFTADVVTYDCMDGWTRFGDSCYYFGRNDVTFNDAQQFCEHFHCNLVNIETQTEMAFLRSYLSELKAPTHWIGLTDELIEDVWKLYPSEVNAPFLDWYPGEPNQGNGANCAAIYETFGYHWIDEPCAHHHRAICETPIETDAIVG
ncbi:C-type lectin (CTL) or carbohydrate-recognition domain (CRD) [Mactra antiquata]